jgi:hypothetical protein
MNFLLTANLTTKIATEGSGAWTPPAFTFGEQITIALRLARNSGGTAIETSPVVNSMKADIGELDARPLGGTWRLKLGDDPQDDNNTTAVMQAGAPASTVAAAINALTAIVAAHGAATVLSVTGSLMVIFASGHQVTLTVVENRLWPMSLGHRIAYVRDERWIHELRLTRVPVAFTSTSAEVLPPPPQITRIQAGHSESGVSWNEIQEIYVPFEFRGTYYLQLDPEHSGPRTQVLSIVDGPERIADALNKIGNGFTGTDTLFQRGNIEFIDDLGATPQPLLGVHVAANPPGDLTFTLALDRAELWVFLRGLPPTESEAVLPLEVRLNVTENEVTSEIVAFRQNVIIRKPLFFPELLETPRHDWLRPLSPKRYFDYDPSQTLFAPPGYPQIVGDDAETVFSIPHGLDSLVTRTWVSNRLTGAQLVEGTHYSVVNNSANEATVTALGDPPAEDAWLVVVMGLQSISAFATDLTIAMEQVTGLLAWQDAVGANLAQLNTLLPSQASVPAGTELSQGPFTIEFSEKKAVLFTAETDLAKLPLRAPFMLPAVHDASVVTLPDPLPTPAAGSVWINETGAGVRIPGGGHGIRSSIAPDDGHVASDGRVLWPARRSGTTNSYFPRPFELQLFAAFVNDLQFGVGKTLTLQLQIATQLIAATSYAQWMIVIEKGTAPREADSTAAAVNITTTGTGTHTATTETGRTVGTFTAATSDVITLAGHGLVNGDVILVSTTGTLPGGLAAATLYVVRDATTDTFKVAPVTTSQNLRDVIWDPVSPLVRQQLILTPDLIRHQIGATITRSAAGITANAVLYNRILNADAGAPVTANFGLRGWLKDFDTENSVPSASGWVSWQFLKPESGILGISIS